MTHNLSYLHSVWQQKIVTAHYKRGPFTTTSIFPHTHTHTYNSPSPTKKEPCLCLVSLSTLWCSIIQVAHSIQPHEQAAEIQKSTSKRMMNLETDLVMEVEEFGFNGFDLLALNFLNLWSPTNFANAQGMCWLWKSFITSLKMDIDPLQFNSLVLQSFLANFIIPMSEVMSVWRVYYLPNCC